MVQPPLKSAESPDDAGPWQLNDEKQTISPFARDRMGQQLKMGFSCCVHTVSPKVWSCDKNCHGITTAAKLTKKPPPPLYKILY